MTKQNFIKYILLVLLILIPITTLMMIHHYAVNVPFDDQYALIPMIQSVMRGHIPFAALWAQHNEHRVFFPNVILLSLAMFTHWSIIDEIYLSFIISLIGFLGLYLLINRYLKDKIILLTVLILSAAVYFSAIQWQNWLWGWQLEWFLCLSCVIWSVNLIDRLSNKTKLKSFFVPGLLAFVATFSLAAGFLAWIIPLGILVVRKFKIPNILVWLSGAIISTLLYFYHYIQPSDGLTQKKYLDKIPSVAKNYAAYIGGSVSEDKHIAVFVGVYLLTIFVVCILYIIKAKQISKYVTFIGVGLAPLIFGILVVIGRFNLGITNALSSRYTSFSELLIISIICIASIIIIERKKLNIYFNIVILVVLILPILFYSWFYGIIGMQNQHQLTSSMYSCSRQKYPSAQCLYQVYFPSSQVAKQDIMFLKSKGLGGY
ncbi:MAG: hypothetical protein ACYCPS_01625 [Candidatus Saccharimonadales bacterium]